MPTIFRTLTLHPTPNILLDNKEGATNFLPSPLWGGIEGGGSLENNGHTI